MSVVPLQADETQTRTMLNLASQGTSRFARLDAAATHADIDLDENADLHVRGNRGPGKFLHVAGVIHANAHLSTPSQLGQAPQLGWSNDLVGNEEVVEAGPGQHFGFA